MSSKLSIVFMVGAGNVATISLIREVMKLDGIEVGMVISEVPRHSIKRRFRNLVNNTKRNGPGYIPYRVLAGIHNIIRSANNGLISDSEVLEIARKAFPERLFTLEDLTREYDIPVRYVSSMNGPESATILDEGKYDLGVVLGTEILKPHIFKKPRLGSINIHKGKVPEYRGMPYGFWELYDRAGSASVTIHKVEAGLDTGDVLTSNSVTIHPNETLGSLQKKLDDLSVPTLIEAIKLIYGGEVIQQKQTKKDLKPRTTPNLKTRMESRHFTGEPVSLKELLVCILKGLHTLITFRIGIPSFSQRMRQISGKPRGVILLYHRICPHDDNLSTDLFQFIRHILILNKRYTSISLQEAYEIVKGSRKLQRDSFCITFDDCYKSVCEEALPVLDVLGIKAGLFIASGFIGKDRCFLHDTHCPVSFKNMEEKDVLDAHNKGHLVAAHTVNHINIGESDVETVKQECQDSRECLQEITGTQIPFFSFPFGLPKDTSREATEALREAGVEANFSAFGGTLNSTINTLNIKRLGICGRHNTSGLILDFEGLSPYALKSNRRG